MESGQIKQRLFIKLVDDGFCAGSVTLILLQGERNFFDRFSGGVGPLLANLDGLASNPGGHLRSQIRINIFSQAQNLQP